MNNGNLFNSENAIKNSKCKRHTKASGSVYGTKREIITANKDQYSISKMCSWLNIPRSSYYYQAVKPVSETVIEKVIKTNFHESKSRYGVRKITQVPALQGICLSRRRIRRIMERLHLVSVYQKVAFKPDFKGKNEAPIPIRIDRKFN